MNKSVKGVLDLNSKASGSSFKFAVYFILILGILIASILFGIILGSVDLTVAEVINVLKFKLLKVSDLEIDWSIVYIL